MYIHVEYKVVLSRFIDQLKFSEANFGQRALRSETRASGGTHIAGLPLPERKKRRQLTPEELEARRTKV